MNATCRPADPRWKGVTVVATVLPGGFTGTAVCIVMGRCRRDGTRRYNPCVPAHTRSIFVAKRAVRPYTVSFFRNCIFCFLYVFPGTYEKTILNPRTFDCLLHLRLPCIARLTQNIQSRCPGLSMVDLCGTSINPEAFARSDGEGEGDVIQGGAPLPWHTY